MSGLSAALSNRFFQASLRAVMSTSAWPISQNPSHRMQIISTNNSGSAITNSSVATPRRFDSEFGR